MAAKKKATPKKATTKKAPAKKAVAKKAPTKAATPKTTAIKEKMTKTKIIEAIVQDTGLTKKEVASVFGSLESLIERSTKKRSVGEFTFPGLMKIVTVKKPARKAKKNVPNPFNPGEIIDVAAKPASMTVKIRPLSKLKRFPLS